MDLQHKTILVQDASSNYCSTWNNLIQRIVLINTFYKIQYPIIQLKDYTKIKIDTYTRLK